MKTVKWMGGPNVLFYLPRHLVVTKRRFQLMSRKLQTSSLRSSGEVPKSERMFNPTRLNVARKRRGLTKIEFAKQMGVALRSFKAYELGEYPPSEDAINKITSVSGFPADFFFGD